MSARRHRPPRSAAAFCADEDYRDLAGGSCHRVRAQMRPFPDHAECQRLRSPRYSSRHRSHELVDELEQRHSAPDPRAGFLDHLSRCGPSHLEEIFLLVGEVKVEGALAQPGGPRDGRNRRRLGRLLEAPFIPHLEGGLNQLATGIPRPGLDEPGTTWCRGGAGCHARDVIGCRSR